jgi:hypothetical protein
LAAGSQQALAAVAASALTQHVAAPVVVPVDPPGWAAGPQQPPGTGPAVVGVVVGWVIADELLRWRLVSTGRRPGTRFRHVPVFCLDGCRISPEPDT